MNGSMRIYRSCIRLIIISIVMLMFMAVSAVSIHADADHQADITSPENGAVFETGKSFTVTVSAYWASPSGIGGNNYIYYKVFKGNERIDYSSKDYSGIMIPGNKTVSLSFTFDEEGDYRIEVYRDANFNGSTHIDLPETSFVAEDSVTVKLQKDISAATVSGIDPQVYTGNEHKPAPVVTIGDKTLNAETDYNVQYSNNINAGPATVTVTGKDYYKGTASGSFEITPADFTMAKVTGIENRTYNGSEQTQTPVVTWNGRTLNPENDYNVAYSDNTNAGTAQMILTGKGNFTGEIIKTFTIDPATIRNATITGLENKTYTGSPQTLNLTLKMGDKTLRPDTDYTITYKNNIGPGTATVTIKGTGNYKDSLIRTFSIKEVSSSSGGHCTIMAPNNGASFNVGEEVQVELNGEYETPVYGTTTLTGMANSLWLKITRGSTQIVYGRISYTSTNDIKVYKFNPDTKGVYTIQLCRCVEWELDPPGSTNLAPKTIEPEDFVPTAQIEIYVGMQNKSITSAKITGISDKQYTGNSITQSPKLELNGTTLKNGTDYYLLYTNNLNVGEATLTIKGMGNYSGTVEKKFNITPKQITADMISLEPSTFTYNESLQKPDVTVMNNEVLLSSPSDYTLINEGGIEPGQYEVSVSAAENSNYTGTAVKTYKIEKISLKNAVVTLAYDTHEYVGTPQCPGVSVKLGDKIIPDEYYNVSYSNNVNIGTATVTVTAKGDSVYKDSATASFQITKVYIDRPSIIMDPINDVTYNRAAQEPDLKLTYGEMVLVKGTDYEAVYDNNTNAGLAKVTITGKGKFTGSRTEYFTIRQKEITDPSVKVEPIPYQRLIEGLLCEPEVVVMDGSDRLTDAEVTIMYSDNDKAGTANVTVYGSVNYKGSIEGITFEILERYDYAKRSLSDRITDLETAFDSYLNADKPALQEAINTAKSVLEKPDATAEELENANIALNEAAKIAEDNLEAAVEAANKLPSAEETEAAILAQKTDKDPAGSKFGTLRVRSPKQTKTSNVLNWQKVSGAARYVIYGSKCGNANRIKKIATVKTNKYTHKKLKKGKYYKYVVVAVKDTVAGPKTIAISKMIHVSTKGSKYGNYKKVSVSKTVIRKAKSLKKGKTLKLGAKAVKASSKARVHTGLRYESSNKKIATVSKKGEVKGVKKGTCSIFVYAQNGIYKKISVKVK